MLSNNDMVELYKEATEKGYIEKLPTSSNFSCYQGCDECPAGRACEQLSVDMDYTKFIKNFDKQVAPLIMEQNNV